MSSSSLSDPSQALMLARLEHLQSCVDALLDRLPSHQRKWISPTELAKQAGVSVRTIQNWREKGVFSSDSCRSGGRSYQYHADLALRDVDALQS